MRVYYIVINKTKISNQSFKNAPYGIPYNYFTGKLLTKLIFEQSDYDIQMIYDKRNKETHNNRHFMEYINTTIFSQALERNVDLKFTISGLDSHSCYGLSAVDLFSWSIFKKYEFGNSEFFDKVSTKFGEGLKWYVEG